MPENDLMIPEQYRIAHRFSSLHAQRILEGTKEVGCFCCCIVFHPSEIVKWIDSNQTAICPYCGVDSVIPCFPVRHPMPTITDEFLREMGRHYFWNGKALLLEQQSKL